MIAERIHGLYFEVIENSEVVASSSAQDLHAYCELDESTKEKTREVGTKADH